MICSSYTSFKVNLVGNKGCLKLQVLCLLTPEAILRFYFPRPQMITGLITNLQGLSV